MTITLNGQERTIAAGTTVAALVDELGGTQSGRGVAVALDGTVVPFSQWAATSVPEGSSVEIVVAVQGG